METNTLAENSYQTTFKRLSPSTRYTVVARPIADTCSRIVPGSVECITEGMFTVIAIRVH